MQESNTTDTDMIETMGSSYRYRDIADSVDQGMWIYPHMLRAGDQVIEDYETGDRKRGRRKVDVKTVTPLACSSKGTHVNGQMCYDRSIRVRIKRL